jgi:predicted small lipoprotein YifL
MRQILLIVTAVLLVLVLSVAVAGCRKSSGKKGGGYLPAPTTSTVPATAVA